MGSCLQTPPPQTRPPPQAPPEAAPEGAPEAETEVAPEPLRPSGGEEEEEEPSREELQVEEELEPGQRQLEVTCPEGAGPGAQLQVTAPEGNVVQVSVPPGVAPGGTFKVRYVPAAAPASQNNINARTNNLTNNLSNLPFGGLAKRAISKASAVTIAKTGKSPEEWLEKIKADVSQSTADWRSRLTKEMDTALSSCDESRINSLLDSAMAGRVLRSHHAPNAVRKAAIQVASRQLKAAIVAGNAKQLKGALVAAKRLHASEVPEFSEAAQKYKEIKKLPAGFDIQKMVLHRKGDKMVAKMLLSEPAVQAKFQRLLDLTHRKVYTRDRQGQPVPERLELVSVMAVTNDDLWGDYMARRESVRQELAKDPADFERYSVDTCNTAAPEAPPADDKDAAKPAEASPADAEAPTAAAAPAPAEGESAEELAAALAADFAEPLLGEANEVFLFHGTSAAAVEKITTAYFNINLAGSSAGTLYGRGVYLAENSTKADEYTQPQANGNRHLLLCRATLGRVHYTDAKVTDPRACENACLKDKFHSVLGDRKKCRGTFREFILFDEEQVYPNYILTYRRAGGKVDKAKTMEVVCPAGAAPGQTLQVKSPDGTIVHVMVPAGVTPGQKFMAQY